MGTTVKRWRSHCYVWRNGNGGKQPLQEGLARGLGIEHGISSPTFALVHEYKGRLTVYHFDMFRVESWDDLYSTGFYDYLETGAVLVIEWSEHIEEALPKELH